MNSAERANIQLIFLQKEKIKLDKKKNELRGLEINKSATRMAGWAQPDWAAPARKKFFETCSPRQGTKRAGLITGPLPALPSQLCLPP